VTIISTRIRNKNNATKRRERRGRERAREKAKQNPGGALWLYFSVASSFRRLCALVYICHLFHAYETDHMS
jgi:hypothetical protein